ncbi:MAG: FG-GAP-like repeat-containing protein [Myxococcota bacterium]
MRSSISAPLITLSLSLSACGGESASDPSNRLTVRNGDEVDDRLILRSRPVPLISTRKSVSLAGTSSVSFTEIAELTPPTVAGDGLQATSVFILGSLAYVSYALVGSDHKGAVDVIDISDRGSPSLVSQLTFADTDVNAVVASADALYLAVSSESFSFPETAAVERIETTPSGTILSATSIQRPLSSFVATGLQLEGSSLYATSGDDGGLYRLDATSLAVTASTAVAGARWVDADGSQVAVHADGNLSVFDAATLTSTGTFAFSTSGDADAKSMVRFEGSKTFLTAGTDGVRVLSAATGDLLQTLPLTSPGGVAAADVVANGLALSGSWLFVAQGGAGVSVAKADNSFAATGSEVLSPIDELGVLGLDGLESANHVEVESNHLFVASGNGGTKIILLLDSNAFTDVSVASGFAVQTQSDGRPSGHYWADFDDDGDLDVVAFGSAGTTFFDNLGSSFSATQSLGNNERDACMADLDDDGDMDIYHQDSRFFENSAGTLSNQGNQGMTGPSNEEGIACIDVNFDGWSDVVIFSANGVWVGNNQNLSPLSLSNTNGTTIGLSGGNGNMAATGDVNDDGLLDIFWDDNGGGLLFLSDGSGGFIQNNQGISVSSVESNEMAFADYDNDGDVDLFYPTGSGDFSHLWRNDEGTFVDTATAAGIDNIDELKAAAWGDYDNDGDLDLYLGCHGCPNLMYVNDGDGTFTEATPAGADVGGDTQTAVFVDYDGDGDLDISLNQEDEANVLLRNDNDSGQALRVRAVGKGTGGSNRAGIGVRIRLYDATGTVLQGLREQGVQKGGGTEPAWVHFGGVSGSESYVVQADFESGTVTATITPDTTSSTIGGNVINKLLTLTEP